MKVEYINPFVGSTEAVFSTMLHTQLTRGEIFLKKNAHPHYDVSGIIGLSGKAVGTVVLSLDENVAIGAAAAMLLECPSEINAQVIDAVGELTNIIAGRAKAKLEQFNLSASLPSVITGKGHSIEFPSNATPIGIPFESPWGPLMIEVGLIEQPAEVLV